MKNQVDSIRSYSDTDDVAHFLNSSLTKAQMKKVKEDITDGKTKILFIVHWKFERRAKNPQKEHQKISLDRKLFSFDKALVTFVFVRKLYYVVDQYVSSDIEVASRHKI